MSKPNFFIVGAPKCGTTALHEYLNAHPDIYMSEVKEPYYFGQDQTGARHERYRGDVADYLALFSGATGEKRIGESTPNYLMSESAAREIRAFDPAAKIIIMLRNPPDLLLSMYQHRRYMGSEEAPTFEAAILPELEGRDSPTRKGDTLAYFDVALYAKHVKRYFDIFGRDQVKVIIFDDFTRDLPRVYRETLAFLGVDETFMVDFKAVNVSKEVRSPRVEKLLKTVGLTPRQLRDSRLFHTVTRVLPNPVYQSMIRFGTRLYTRPAAKNPMSPEIRQRIIEHVRADVGRLETLLERDLSHWLT